MILGGGALPSPFPLSLEAIMAAIKCNGITSFCVAGFVGIPDKDGIVNVPDEVLASEEFARLRSECPEGSFIPAEVSSSEENGKPSLKKSKG